MIWYDIICYKYVFFPLPVNELGWLQHIKVGILLSGINSSFSTIIEE